MIPVLICPVLVPGRIGAMVGSVDVPVDRWIVIDNGAGIEAPGAIHLPSNLGVAASWNLGLRLTPDAPWWFITNDDIVFAPGDLARLAEAMDANLLVTLDGFAAFGIRREAVDRVGLFDENFHPAYCEDADYEYRCKLAGVSIVTVPSKLRHDRSSLIADPHYGAENARTYPENRAYYRAKWGGDLRGGETFTTPFDSGAEPSEWTEVPARRRKLAWRRKVIDTTAIEPVMERR